MEKYYLFLFLAFIAEIIGTISGFGSSILFVPIASIFLPFKDVLAITAVFHVFSNLSKIALFRQNLDKQIVLKLGLPAVIFVIIGALLTKYIPQREIELGMNIILVFLAIFLMIQGNKKIEQSNGNLYAGGVISGFLAGLIGTGGAIRGITLAAFNLEKNVFVATSAMIDLGVDSSRALIYIINGYFLKEYLILIPFLIGISLAGSYIGKLLLNKIPDVMFKYLVLILIIATSIYQMLKYFEVFK